MSIEAALLLLNSQYQAEQNSKAMQDEIQRIALENAKLRAAQREVAPKKEKGSKGRPIQGTAPMKGILRSPTVESSTTFLVAARRAANRAEGAAAIDAFVGYDVAGDFGAQDTRARSLAISCLKPQPFMGPTREEVRAAELAARGFVAGVADAIAKAKANLKAQSEVIISAIVEAEKDGNEAAATLERERLAHVRTQLATLG